MLALTAQSPARESYALLSGWGTALYLGYVLGAYSMVSIAVVAVGTGVASFALAVSGSPMLGYHDFSPAVHQQVLFVALAQAALVSSPVVINTMVNWCSGRVRHLALIRRSRSS
jgi:hypothetical protein